MASAKGLIAEMEHISGWAAAQVEAGLTREEVAQSQFEVIHGKVKLLKCVQYEHATALTKAVQTAAGQIGWTSDQKMRLVLAVNTVLKPSHDKLAGAVTRRKNQECDTFELYLTLGEVTKLSNKTLNDRALANVCKVRAKKMGLHCASEECKGRIAQTIRALQGEENTDAREFHKLLEKVRTAFTDLKKNPWPYDWITEYKADPMDLPPDIFKAAYGDGEPPARHVIPGLEPADFLRKNAKELTPPKQQPTVVQPNGVDMTSLANLFGPAMMVMMSRFMNMESQGSPSQGSSSARLDFNMGSNLGAPRRGGGRGPPPDAICDEPAEELCEGGAAQAADGGSRLGGGAPALGRPSSRPCLADLSEPDLTDEEETLRTAITKRKQEKEKVPKAKAKPVGKRPAAADATAPEEPAVKQPRTSNATVKRPAAAPAPKAKTPAPKAKTPAPKAKAPAPKAKMVKAGAAHQAAPIGSRSNPPQCVQYRGAYVYTSWTKGGYRCVLNPAENPSDRLFNWKKFGGHAQAWEACLTWVDGER